MKNRSEFLLGMLPFRGLFDSPDDLKTYYGLYRGGTYTALSPFIRAAFRKIGYSVLVPKVSPDSHDRLHKASGGPVDYDRICAHIPSDFVLSFSDGFYGTRLEGSFVITDLLDLGSNDDLYIVGRNSIFHQILVNYVVSGNSDYDGENTAIKRMHRFYMDNRLSDDFSTMAKCFVVREFLYAMGSLPDSMRYVYSDATYLSLSRRLAVAVMSYKMIFDEASLLCDYSFNEITDKFHYKKFFDQFADANPPLLQEFVGAYRLDT